MVCQLVLRVRGTMIVCGYVFHSFPSFAYPHFDMFFQVSRSLAAIAGELALAAPAATVGVNDFDNAKLDWARLPCQWFPGVSAI